MCNSHNGHSGVIRKDDESAITHSSTDLFHRITQGNTMIVTSMPDWSVHGVTG